MDVKMNLPENWHTHEMTVSDEEKRHSSMDQEFLFYRAVQNGDSDYVERNLEAKEFLNSAGKGTLSPDPVRNIKYHFIVTAAMLTRNCAAAGMSMEQAYRLSDYYIQNVDSAKSCEEVNRIHSQMVLDFTRRMHDYQNQRTISKPVHNAIECIYSNINKRITVNEIAEMVQLSPSHLSRLFKKEMGLSISDYIRGKKIEHAKNLLRYSDYSYVDIANYLSFDSQSHFIKVFKKYEGITPRQYRNQYHHSSW